jgi:extradiol dioxygenase family protein
MKVMMFLRKPLLHYTKHTLNIKLSMLHDGVVLCLDVSTFIGTEKVSIEGCTMTISPKIQPTGHLSSGAGLLIAN